MKGLKVSLVLMILTISSLSVVEGLAEKPRGPLELTFSVDPSPAIGALVRMTLAVTARVDAPELVISIELPNDLPHLDGELRWAGSAVKDQPASVVFQVGPLSDRSYEIVGRATVTLPNGSTWSQATSIVLEPVMQEKPLPPLKHGRRGQAIQEIPVQ